MTANNRFVCEAEGVELHVITAIEKVVEIPEGGKAILRHKMDGIPLETKFNAETQSGFLLVDVYERYQRKPSLRYTIFVDGRPPIVEIGEKRDL